MHLISRLRSSFSKVILMTLMAIYLFFSVGVLKATHFCMGREASVTFFSADSKKCACSLFAGEKDSCCDDKNEVVRLEDDQQNSVGYSIQVPQLYILEDLYTERLITATKAENLPERYTQAEHDPPSIPLFKMYCSFVFYGDEKHA